MVHLSYASDALPLLMKKERASNMSSLGRNILRSIIMAPLLLSWKQLAVSGAAHETRHIVAFTNSSICDKFVEEYSDVVKTPLSSLNMAVMTFENEAQVELLRGQEGVEFVEEGAL